MDTISAVIVTFNTGAVVCECIQRLKASQGDFQLEIIVVDNQSSDNTVTLIQENFPDSRILINSENRGFGHANNRGVEISKGEYVLIVNPDLMVHPEAVAVLLSVLKDSGIGVVGPKTKESSGEISITARPEYTPGRIAAKYLALDRIFPSLVYGDARQQAETVVTPFETDWLQGSCLLMRRSLFDAIGGFDEAFFLYMEDTDLCAQIRDQGLKVVYVPGAVAIHHGGTTTSRFPLIRVRSYHLSPLIYWRKRGRKMSVLFLKLVFTLELTLKATGRLLLFPLHRNRRHLLQAKAEIQVIRNLWGY